MKVLVAIRNWCGAHKKLTATIIGLAINAIPDSVIDAAHRQWLSGTLIAYVLGQGVADAGKEKAKVELGAKSE